MPDENKFKKLRDMGYTIKPTCQFCVHSNFGPGCSFGTCGLHKYEHKKHSGAPRGVSIHKSGTCGDVDPLDERVMMLGAYEEFLECVFEDS